MKFSKLKLNKNGIVTDFTHVNINGTRKKITKVIFNGNTYMLFNKNLKSTTLDINGSFNKLTVSGNVEQKVLNGYNLAPFPYVTAPVGQTVINGITYTVKSDGKILATGTAQGDSVLPLYTSVSAIHVSTDNLYSLSGAPVYSNLNTYYMSVKDTAFSDENVDLGNGVTFSPLGNRLIIYITVKSGITVNNLEFSPMLSVGEIKPFEEYCRGLPSPGPYSFQEIYDENKGDFYLEVVTPNQTKVVNIPKTLEVSGNVLNLDMRKVGLYSDKIVVNLLERSVKYQSYTKKFGISETSNLQSRSDGFYWTCISLVYANNVISNAFTTSDSVVIPPNIEEGKIEMFNDMVVVGLPNHINSDEAMRNYMMGIYFISDKSMQETDISATPFGQELLQVLSTGNITSLTLYSEITPSPLAVE